MSERNAEYRGYLAVCQSADGLIHLISSRQHYAFNLKWLMTPAPPISSVPVKVKRVVETFNGPQDFDAEGWVDYHSYLGGFNGRGQYKIESLTHHNGINRIIGAGSFEATLTFKRIGFHPRGDDVSEGLSIWIKDDREHFLALSIKEDQIELEVRDAGSPLSLQNAHYRVTRGWSWGASQAEYSSPPTAAALKFIWDEDKRRMRIFYGLNGSDAIHEMPQNEAGLHFGRPLSESTTIYILMSNGTIDIDHFEVTPTAP
jgi:hypothetical protein